MFTNCRLNYFHLLIIALFYTINWALILINIDGIYWDDWTILYQNVDAVSSTFATTGSLFAGHFHSTFLTIEDPVLAYRLVTFLSYLTVAICTYILACRLDFFNPEGALILAVIVSIYPINHARIAIINTPYAYSLMLFYIAFVLGVTANIQKSIILRALSLLLFFISFEVMSLLAFYIVPILYLFSQDQKKTYQHNDNFTQHSIKWIARNLDFLLLPFVFIGIKFIFFQPTGVYKNYNSITLDSLIGALGKSFSAIPGAFVEPLEGHLKYFIAAAIIICLLFSVVITRRTFSSFKATNIFCALIGLGILYLSFFPYLAVNKTPSFYDWNGRHYLLAPLGVSLSLYGITYLFSKPTRIGLVLLITITATIINTNILYGYLIDDLKQKSIGNNLVEIAELKDKKGVILFKDNMLEANALKRTYRFYEFNGLLKKTLKSEMLLGIYHTQTKYISSWGKYSSIETYNFRDYLPSSTKVIGQITIDKGSYNLSPIQVLNLFIEKTISPSKYTKHIKEITSLSFTIQ